MKKLMIASLILGASLAQAAEVTVLEANVRGLETYYPRVHTQFYMDQTTGDGFAKVAVVEDRPYMDWSYNRGGHRVPEHRTRSVVVFQETVKIDGLMLMDDKVIYHGEDGDVDCGTMGVSRIFRRPTIYLSGNCKLSGKMSRNQLTLKLKTK